MFPGASVAWTPEKRDLMMIILSHLTTDKEPEFLLVKLVPQTWMIQEVVRSNERVPVYGSL